MSRLHDMGARFGDGPVVPDFGQEPVFKEDWHGRALAVTLAAGSLGQWNLDVSRHARECLSPVDYGSFSYYEKWISALADLLANQGVLTSQDMIDAVATPHPLAHRAMRSENVAAVLAAGGPTDRKVTSKPKFQIGETVCTKRAENRFVSGGHTRLPQYAERSFGTIVAHRGAHVLPDSNAHGLGEAPEHLYSVALLAKDLFEHPEHPEDEVILDLWESYLKGADDVKA